MVLVTKLTRALGIRHPIVQGGMHHVGLAPLAAAVSNAGGLGVITALTQPTPADLRKEIQKCRTMTDKPFGVNFTIIPSFKSFDFDGFANVWAFTCNMSVIFASKRARFRAKVLRLEYATMAFYSSSNL